MFQFLYRILPRPVILFLLGLSVVGLIAAACTAITLYPDIIRIGGAVVFILGLGYLFAVFFDGLLPPKKP